MLFGVQQGFPVTVVKDAEAAVEKGFKYLRPEHLPIEIKHAVIVKDGTVGGHATVDLIMVDENGQKYVVMVTANLLRAVLGLAG